MPAQMLKNNQHCPKIKNLCRHTLFFKLCLIIYYNMLPVIYYGFMVDIISEFCTFV